MLHRLAQIVQKLRIFQVINLKDSKSAIRKCDILLLCHDDDRGLSLGGKAYSPILDSFKEHLESQGYSTLTIAHPWSKLVGAKAFGKPIAINRSYLIAMIEKMFFKADSVKNLYKDIFSRANPQQIVTIGCTDELCMAAHELGIHHAELLHGIGYSPMPWNWDKKDRLCLPQEILTLDDVSTATFKPLEGQGVKVKQIEHPFLGRFRAERIGSLPEEWRVKTDKTFEKEILVSLQWGYAEGIDCSSKFEGILSNGLIPEELINVIARTQDKVLWRFRFHPVHIRNMKKYKKHFSLVKSLVDRFPNCEWEESTFKPVSSVVSRCDGHITMISMTSYEAAYMGVPTLALCPTLQVGGVYESFFSDLVENGYVVKGAVKEDSIMTWVQNLKKKTKALKM